MEPFLAPGGGPRRGGGNLRDHAAHFRNEIVEGVGGRQILVEDPFGNPVELFEPTRDEARLGT